MTTAVQPRAGRGMGWFGVLWAAQAITLTGNSALRFAFVLLAWTSQGKATPVVALNVCGVLPQVLLSPVAGAVADRARKRTALQLADWLGLAVVAAFTVAYVSGHLAGWQIYVAVALLGAAAAFAYPALSSAVPLLVDAERLPRANGLLGATRSIAEVAGPALGGALMAAHAVGGVLALDLVSFAVALLCVQLVPFGPATTGRAAQGPARRGSLADSLDGLRFLAVQPGPRGLVLVVAVVNLVMVFGYAVVPPMVLARSGGDSTALSSVMACIGVGGIVGGLALFGWRGTRHRVPAMLAGIIGMSVTSLITLALVRGTVAWSAAMLCGALLMSVVNGLSTTIISARTRGRAAAPRRRRPERRRCSGSRWSCRTRRSAARCSSGWEVWRATRRGTGSTWWLHDHIRREGDRRGASPGGDRPRRLRAGDTPDRPRRDHARAVGDRRPRTRRLTARLLPELIASSAQLVAGVQRRVAAAQAEKARCQAPSRVCANPSTALAQYAVVDRDSEGAGGTPGSVPGTGFTYRVAGAVGCRRRTKNQAVG